MRYGPANITTAVLLGFALWVIFTRMRSQPGDNNWPMVFYPVIILFTFQLPGRVEPNAILTGFATSLLLRFEFVGGFFSHLLKAIDLFAMSMISYYLLGSMTI